MRATIIKSGIGCLLGLLAFSALASADLLAPNHPQTYKVKRGDTLWDIAGHFLNEPWRWPEVWTASDIENPHRLYPGDVIVLKVHHDTPSLSVERGGGEQGYVSDEFLTKDGERIVKLSPRVRSEPANDPIPTIPLSVIGPFLSKSKVTPVGALDSEHEISAVDEERLLVSQGNRFYAADLSSSIGEALSIYRPGRVLLHPETGQALGQEAIYLGFSEVEVPGDMSTLILRKVEGDIRAGDKLLPIEKDRLEPYFFPKSPSHEGRGFILSVLGGVNQVGRNQVVTISGGDDLGREEGDVLAIFQQKSDLPSRVKSREDFEKRMNKDAVSQYHFAPTKVGQLIVFKTFDKTSMALVMDAVRTINLGDEVKRP